MKSEINLYDKDMNYIKTFKSVEECAEFFDKEKNYIHYNLKYRDKIGKDGTWYKIRRIIRDEKQEEIYRLNNIINELSDFIIKIYQKELDNTSDWWLQEELKTSFDDINLATNFRLEEELLKEKYK